MLISSIAFASVAFSSVANAREACRVYPRHFEMVGNPCDRARIFDAALYDSAFAADVWNSVASHEAFIAAWQPYRGAFDALKESREDWAEFLKRNPDHAAARDDDFAHMWDMWQYGFNLYIQVIEYDDRHDFRNFRFGHPAWTDHRLCEIIERQMLSKVSGTCDLPDWAGPLHRQAEVDRRQQALQLEQRTLQKWPDSVRYLN